MGSSEAGEYPEAGQPHGVQNGLWGQLSGSLTSPGNASVDAFQLDHRKDRSCGPWILKCGLQTSSISIARELVRNAEFQALPPSYWIRICTETHFPGDFCASLSPSPNPILSLGTVCRRVRNARVCPALDLLFFWVSKGLKQWVWRPVGGCEGDPSPV